MERKVEARPSCGVGVEKIATRRHQNVRDETRCACPRRAPRSQHGQSTARILPKLQAEFLSVTSRNEKVIGSIPIGGSNKSPGQSPFRGGRPGHFCCPKDQNEPQNEPQSLLTPLFGLFRRPSSRE